MQNKGNFVQAQPPNMAKSSKFILCSRLGKLAWNKSIFDLSESVDTVDTVVV